MSQDEVGGSGYHAQQIWSAELVDILIQSIHKYPALYDQSDPDHSNRDMIEQIWNRIGSKIDRTGEACSKKWQTLRAGYRKRKKDHIGRSGSGAKRAKVWAFYDSLTFLDPYMNDRKTITNIRTTSSPSCSSEQSLPGPSKETLSVETEVETYVADSEGFLTMDEAPSDGEDSEERIETEAEKVEVAIEETPRHKAVPRKKKTFNNNVSIEEDMRKYLKSATEKINNSNKEVKTSMELFLQSLVEDANTLNSRAQREFKKKL